MKIHNVELYPNNDICSECCRYKENIKGYYTDIDVPKNKETVYISIGSTQDKKVYSYKNISEESLEVVVEKMLPQIKNKIKAEIKYWQEALITLESK